MARVVVVVATFYKDLAEMLIEGAKAPLSHQEHHLEIVEVPGVYEIPAALSMAKASGLYDGYLALGCVIRGETSHYDLVCQAAGEGISRFAVKHRVPVGFGVITAENRKQAIERASLSGRDFGGKAAKACLRMLELQQRWAKA